MLNNSYIIFLIALCAICHPCHASLIVADTATFGQSIDLGLVEYDKLNEASGLAVSHRYTNVLWSHNDSGDESRIYAMSYRGKHLAAFQLKDIEAIDWEDIACGSGPVTQTSYLYIADIGDNKAQRQTKFIYRLLEPEIKESSPKSIVWITQFDQISYQYSDGMRDAESLLIDSKTLDLYIVSKREEQVGVYKLAYPQSLKTINTAEKMATLPFSWAVAGDLSSNSNELLIKTEQEVYYWKKASGDSISTFFKTPNLTTVPYTQELQGEAICWARQSMGYFTVSEEPWRIENNAAHLTFYPRLTLLDMNGDDHFDIADILHCFEYISEIQPLAGMPVVPDINFNNRLSIEELIYGLQMLIQNMNK